MIYTPLTKKALKICFQAHKNQTDKNDIPYVFHPFHVAEQMNDENSTVVALLHDVVEDTEYTMEDLKNAGFNDTILTAIDLLTHKDGVSYQDYIEAMTDNPLAVKVKIADLQHNADISRIDNPTAKDVERVEKYRYFLAFLGNL